MTLESGSTSIWIRGIDAERAGDGLAPVSLSSTFWAFRPDNDDAVVFLARLEAERGLEAVPSPSSTAALRFRGLCTGNVGSESDGREVERVKGGMAGIVYLRVMATFWSVERNVDALKSMQGWERPSEKAAPDAGKPGPLFGCLFPV